MIASCSNFVRFKEKLHRRTLDQRTKISKNIELIDTHTRAAHRPYICCSIAGVNEIRVKTAITGATRAIYPGAKRLNDPRPRAS